MMTYEDDTLVFAVCTLLLPSPFSLSLQSEHAITEQYKTVWNGKTLVTECSDINQ